MDDVMLPYRTDWRSMLSVLDYAKGKGVDRATLEARLGAGEALRETINALEQLGLLARDDSGEVRLSPVGERLAYAASDADRRAELASAILSYQPYGIPLERAVADELNVIDAPWIERVWQVDMRLGQPRNRVEEARTFFFRLADDAGLGTFRRGVRGQPTRLELDAGAPDRIRELQAERQEAELTIDRSVGVRAPAAAPSSGSPISLAITVDMSEWDLEKIEAFLQLIGFLPPTS